MDIRVHEELTVELARALSKWTLGKDEWRARVGVLSPMEMIRELTNPGNPSYPYISILSYVTRTFNWDFCILSFRAEAKHVGSQSFLPETSQAE